MNNNFIHALSDIVLANLSNEKFGPEKLALEMGMSHSSLHRKVKDATGKTISQFICKIRLEKAEELLLTKDNTVSEIAYIVGFNSPTYFSKCFHDYFECSPGEYRKREQQKEESEPVEFNTNENKINKRIIFVVAPLLFILAIFFILNKKYLFIQSEPETPNSIVVLKPDYNGNPEFEYQAHGTTEEIINRLCVTEGITVLDQKTIEDYLLNNADKNDADGKIKTGYYLKTIFQPNEEKTIIITKLIRYRDGKILISEIDTVLEEKQYLDGKMIVENIKKEMGIKPTTEFEQGLLTVEINNLTANDFYLQANKILNDYMLSGNKELLSKAEQLNHKALQYDTLFSKAYEDLAIIYHEKYFWKTIHSKNFMDSAMYYANKALSINDKSYKAYHMRGMYFFQQSKFDEALIELEKATILNPNFLQAYRLKAFIYRYLDLSLSIENSHKAVKLSGELLPKSLRVLCFHYYSAGLYKEAEYYLKQALNLDNDSAFYFLYTGYIFQDLNKFDESLLYLNKSYKLNPNNSNLLVHLGTLHTQLKQYEISAKYFDEYIEILKQMDALEGLGVLQRAAYAFWHIGEKEKANKYFDMLISSTLKDIEFNRPFHQYRVIDMAEVYAFRNQKENAYQYLNYVLEQPVCIPYWLNWIVQFDPLLDNLRDDSEFQELALEYNSRYEQEHQKVINWMEKNDVTID